MTPAQPVACVGARQDVPSAAERGVGLGPGYAATFRVAWQGAIAPSAHGARGLAERYPLRRERSIPVMGHERRGAARQAVAGALLGRAHVASRDGRGHAMVKAAPGWPRVELGRRHRRVGLEHPIRVSTRKIRRADDGWGRTCCQVPGLCAFRRDAVPGGSSALW